MHSVQDYLDRKSSKELKGILWTARTSSGVVLDETVLAIWDLLISRGDLDPETIETSEEFVEETRKAIKRREKLQKLDMMREMSSSIMFFG